MDMGLTGKVAVVCAASKGLGKASAMGLAAEGENLVICALGADVLKQTAEWRSRSRSTEPGQRRRGR